MEIDPGAVVLTTVCLAAGYVSLRGAGAAAQVMSHMFDSPARLGWPSGVQEDDDFHWQWSARPAVSPGDTEPAVVDLATGSGPRASRVRRH